MLTFYQHATNTTYTLPTCYKHANANMLQTHYEPGTAAQIGNKHVTNTRQTHCGSPAPHSKHTTNMLPKTYKRHTCQVYTTASALEQWHWHWQRVSADADGWGGGWEENTHSYTFTHTVTRGCP